jgi:hypothetical protein
MHKLKLQLDDLTVESFETSLERPARGTAHAHAAPIIPPDDTGPLCPGETSICTAGEYTGTVDGPGYVTGTCQPVCNSIQITQCLEYC